MIARPLSTTPAVHRPRPNPAATLRLFCFPHAGGGASAFHSWPSFLPPEIELCAIQLPGHETRQAEAPICDLAALLPTLAADISPFLDRPYAFFGHSMGALIAFELARHLRRAGLPSPAQLLLSAHRAPHLPSPHPPAHGLPDAAFLARLRELHGLPAEVQADAGLMRILLPILRADIALCETYVHVADAPLACPIAVLGGLDDPSVSAGMLAAWRKHTSHTCSLRLLPGDHFFPQMGRHLLLRVLSDHLRTVLPESNRS